MRSTSYKIALSFILSFFLFQSCFSIQDEEISKTFKKKENVKISVASANCSIKKSNSGEITIKIIHTYDKDDYVPVFTEGSNQLTIKEEFKENNMSGKAQWFIEIPDNTNINFNSASGDVTCEDLKCKLNLNTASGDVKLNRLYGELKIHTASGDVKIEDANNKITLKTASGDATINNAEGNVEISSASGDVKAQNIKGKISLSTASGNLIINHLSGEIKTSSASGDVEISDLSLLKATSFNTVSGNINLELSKPITEDVSFSSVSGNVKIDFNGNATDGLYEMKAKSRSGSINVPSSFELVSSDENDSRTEKTYKSGSGKPNIKMNTVSGTLSINK
jgi:DUF4097 and DUF4098 domain-containing protein YvlB